MSQHNPTEDDRDELNAFQISGKLTLSDGVNDEAWIMCKFPVEIRQ